MGNSLKHVLVDDLSFDYTRDVAQSGVSSFFLGLRFWRRDSSESLEAQVSELSKTYESLKGKLLFIGEDLCLLRGFEACGGVLYVVLESKSTFDEYLLHWNFKDLQGRFGVNFLNNGRYRFRSIENTMKKLGFQITSYPQV